MRGGRKNLKQGALQGRIELQEDQSIMRVVSLRGSNLIEVENADLQKILCLLPAKFNKLLWIRKGSFVVVSEGERERALESGSKVTGIICQVLFEGQIRALKRSSTWPATFNDEVMQTSSEIQDYINGDGSKEIVDSACTNLQQMSDLSLEVNENDGNSSEDESLPPLEANQNRYAANAGFCETSSDEDTNSGN